jgi:signal transduction histidine kinase
VRIAYAEDAVEVEVRDDGHGAAAEGGAPGHGVVGMRERVALFGGSLEVGPAPEGGWRVRARLPLRAAVAA